MSTSAMQASVGRQHQVFPQAVGSGSRPTDRRGAAIARCIPAHQRSDLSVEPDCWSRRLLLALAVCATQVQPASAATSGSTAGSSKNSVVIAGGATTLSTSTVVNKLSPSEKQVLETNRRVQSQNNAPKEFPNFVRRGYAIRVIADGYSETDQGLIYKDYEQGAGPEPEDGQEVLFHYSGYNESGARIDSSYSKGRPAQTRLGIKGLIPGFEAGLKSMRKGGKRRIVVSPELGPPTGPSTFFSAKQCEVFDVELIDIRTCRRSQVAFFSSVKCTTNDQTGGRGFDIMFQGKLGLYHWLSQ